MATSIRGDASDARTLADGLGRASEALGNLTAVNQAAGDLVVAGARPPRRSGRLDAGLYARATAQDVVVASRAPYWTWVHWGAPRINIRANPFLLAELRATTDNVTRLYHDHARDSLARNL
jgi:hypothetical protein